MTFLTPGLALLAAGIGLPTIILLHVLRLRRLPQRVSSTLLWRRSVQDLEANIPFQRLRPSWLLLLQMLAVLCAALAAGQPLLRRGEAPSSVVIVLDARARMSARIDDAAEPAAAAVPTRFDRARAEARSWIRARAADHTIVHLVVARARPSLVASGSPRAILDALDRLAPTHEPGDAAEAMALAAQVAPEGEILWFGDPVAVRADNLGITLLSAQRGLAEPGTVDLLVGAINSSSEAVEAPLVILLDGEVMAARVLRIPAAGADPLDPPGRATVLLRVPERHGARLEARLVVTDALPLDDAAFLRLAPAAPIRIAFLSPSVSAAGDVAPGPAAESPLLTLLRMMDRVVVEARPCEVPPESLQGYDLVAADGCVPPINGGRAAPPWLVFSGPPGTREAPPDAPRALVSGAPPGASRSHPVLRGVPPFTVDVALRAPTAESSRAPRDAIVLLEAGDRTIAWIDGSAPGVRFEFPLEATDWPGDPSWIMVMQNAVLWLAGDDGDGVGAPLRTGHPARVLVQRRDGSRAWVAVAPPERVGETILRPLDADEVRLDASLLDEPQSDLRPAPAPEDPRGFEVTSLRRGAAEADDAAPDPELEGPRGVVVLWPWLALAAIVVLATEWMLYITALQRRA